MSFYQAERARWIDPHRLAIQHEDERIPYGELEVRVERAAGWLLEQGLGPGDVLALQMPRGTAFLELHLGALALGIATLPLNDRYTPREVNFLLGNSRARLALLVPETHAVLAALECRRLLPAPARIPEDAPRASLPEALDPETPAVLCYTSGTTGRPKGAVISHRNLGATVTALHHLWRWSGGDHLLHALPLFHIHGLFVAQHGALYAGASCTWMDRFEAEAALGLLESLRCTMFMGVPTFYGRFLALDPGLRFDLSRMRLFTSGSAPLPARVHADFEARFQHRILERYGMTEAGIVLSNPCDPATGDRRPGSVGRPVPGAAVEIRDSETGEQLPEGMVGELFIRGPSVIRQYLGQPEQTARAIQGGWLRSGDLGHRDADGYITLVGRGRDLVLVGGLNVYPSEVEAAILEHPSVAEAAVVGLSDPDLGERVGAAVVPAPGAALDADSLLAFCRQRLAPYKCPREVIFIDSLPRNAMGKVERTRLLETWPPDGRG